LVWIFKRCETKAIACVIAGNIVRGSTNLTAHENNRDEAF
jgi:hypothetical protein